MIPAGGNAVEKKSVQVFTIIFFACMLAVPAIAGGQQKSGELGQIRSAMRSLKRVDNLKLRYENSLSGTEGSDAELMEVWCDQLTGMWLSQKYVVDEDGQRPLLKEFCDGRTVFAYQDWNGTWMETSGDRSIPGLDRITSLTYGGNDIKNPETVLENGIRKISFTFTDGYLNGLIEAGHKELDDAYQNYLQTGGDEELLELLAVSRERYEKTEYQDLLLTYTIDEDGVLRSAACSLMLTQPEILEDQSGVRLGNEKKMQVQIETRVAGLNDPEIAEKIKNCHEAVKKQVSE